MNTKEIGQKVKQLRRKKGFTQKDLGELLGYSEAHISHLENGSRNLSIKDIKKLSDIFNVSYDSFLKTKISTPLFRSQKTAPGEEVLSDDMWQNFINFAKKQNEK